MKIAIIADTHFGCRKNSQYFMERQKEYFQGFFGYAEVFEWSRIVFEWFENFYL